MRTEIHPAILGLLGTSLLYSKNRFRPSRDGALPAPIQETIVGASGTASVPERTVSHGQMHRYWARRGLVSPFVLLHDTARETWRYVKKLDESVDSMDGDGFIIEWAMKGFALAVALPFTVPAGLLSAIRHTGKREDTRFEMWEHNKKYPNDKVKFGERQRILFPPEDQYSDYWYHPEDTHGDRFDR